MKDLKTKRVTNKQEKINPTIDKKMSDNQQKNEEETISGISQQINFKWFLNIRNNNLFTALVVRET